MAPSEEKFPADCLRRFDVVYVPRSGVAEAGLFMQQYFRDLLPISFSYAINGNVNGN